MPIPAIPFRVLPYDTAPTLSNQYISDLKRWLVSTMLRAQTTYWLLLTMITQTLAASNSCDRTHFSLWRANIVQEKVKYWYNLQVCSEKRKIWVQNGRTRCISAFSLAKVNESFLFTKCWSCCIRWWLSPSGICDTTHCPRSNHILAHSNHSFIRYWASTPNCWWGWVKIWI